MENNTDFQQLEKISNAGFKWGIFGLLVFLVVYAIIIVHSFKLNKEAKQNQLKANAMQKRYQEYKDSVSLLEHQLNTLKNDLINEMERKNEPIANQSGAPPVSQQTAPPKIVLLAPPSEMDAIKKLLTDSNFTNIETIKAENGTQVNTIWYSKDVSDKYIKKISLILLENNYQISAVRPSATKTTGNTVQIGSTSSLQYFPTLKKKDVKTFDKAEILIDKSFSK
jgi:hypothetical protein